MAKLTQLKRRNAFADAVWAGLKPGYRNTRPLQGMLHRVSRCVVCYEWLECKDYNPARCAGCAEGGWLF